VNTSRMPPNLESVSRCPLYLRRALIVLFQHIADLSPPDAADETPKMISGQGGYQRFL